jgi:hypothetical protein
VVVLDDRIRVSGAVHERAVEALDGVDAVE